MDVRVCESQKQVSVIRHFAFTSMFPTQKVTDELYEHYWLLHVFINPLTPELNLSAQRCLTRFFPGDFAS
jgi:hypothetical protein